MCGKEAKGIITLEGEEEAKKITRAIIGKAIFNSTVEGSLSPK